MKLPVTLVLCVLASVELASAQAPPASRVPAPQAEVVAVPAPVAAAPTAPAPQAPPAATATATAAGAAAVRLKDVATVQGPADMPLVGYGLVVGLNKTGDRRQTIFSAQTLANMLARFGVVVDANEMKIENVAAVLVTAQLSPYASAGSLSDVTVSSIGDARSLQGGTLIPTPLRAPDGQVAALAQGALTLGGFGAGGGGNSVTVNHLTVGRIPRGALLQVARPSPIVASDSLSLSLNDPDFMSAGSLARAVNRELGADLAHVVDAGTVRVDVPGPYRASLPDLIARLEPVPVNVDSVARVVINERTGTVVLGGDVRLGPAAVAHGNLSVRISTQFDVSQPAPFSQGQTTVVPQTDVDMEEGKAQLIALESGTTLADVVRALNLLGVSPRDIIAIMQALKAAGALRAEIVIL
ncbi:MAG: flagellar basal body P-ring protein FlgI [Vicinamibacterales bacterium]